MKQGPTLPILISTRKIIVPSLIQMKLYIVKSAQINAHAKFAKIHPLIAYPLALIVYQTVRMMLHLVADP